MKLIKKIFHNFFLLKSNLIKLFIKILIITFCISKVVLANNNVSILKRLPTSIFATVNGEVISIYDLIQRSNLFSVSAKIPINKNFELRILPDLITGFIDQVIQSQEIEKAGIQIPENQIQQTIANIEKENNFKKGELETYLKENNTDIKILYNQIKANIGWMQLIANKFRIQVIIQDSEVDRIHKNLELNVGKDELFIEQIFLSFENKKENEILDKATNLYEQIIGGADFLNVAKQFSDSIAGKKGKIGWVSELDLDPKIVDQVKKLEINKVSKPIKGINGFYIFKIKQKRIIGEKIINKVSLFKIDLIEENDESISNLKKINDCKELEVFNEKNGTADSGPLGFINFNELPGNLKNEIKKLDKNQISKKIKSETNEFRVMVCDIQKIEPVIPSKFKIREVLISKKLDIIARQYMSELRQKSVIDIRI